MPYYSELGLPSSSAYSSIFLPGPYSNHSSIIASNFSLPKPLPRQYRGGYKPHLSTITELSRINSPKPLYHSSPKLSVVRPIKKIDTADIDVSVNKYKKYDKYEKPKIDNLEKKSPEKSPSPKRSPRASTEDKQQTDAKPNPNIRRDRPTVRLHTVHRDTLKKEIGDFRSWRDNFKPDELEFKPEEFSAEPKRMKKSPGEILKEKFLIRSRSKENIYKPETKRISRKRSVKKSPSFQDICEAITSDNIGVDLNPGQPEEVQRKQSRQISSERLLKDIRRNSTDLSEDDIKLLDAILSEQNSGNEVPEKNDEDTFVSRGSVRKKRFTKKKSSEDLHLDKTPQQIQNRITKSKSKEKVNETEIKSPLERRPTKKRLRKPSLDESVQQVEQINDPLAEELYKNVIRDISQVEIEQKMFKPKPIITGSGEIEETKPSLKAVVNDIEVKESPKTRKEKKFRFNVIVEVKDEEEPENLKNRGKPKIAADRISFTGKKGAIRFSNGKVPVISSILKKKPLAYSGKLLEQKERHIQKDESERIRLEDSKQKPFAVNSNGMAENEDERESTLITSNLFENKETDLKTDSKVPASKLQKNNISPLKSTEGNIIPTSPTLKDKQSLFNKLQSDKANVAALNSKEDSPIPVSPTIKENNLFNKLLSKKENISASSLASTTLSGSIPSTPVSIGSQSFDEIYISASSSPLLSFETNNNKFDMVSYSPDISKECAVIKKSLSTPSVNNILSKQISTEHDTRPASPLVENKNFVNMKLSESSNDILHGVRESSGIDSKLVIGKDENDNTISIFSAQKHSAQKPETTELENVGTMEQKKIVSKRSLVQKANKDDPDLIIFVPPPEPEPEPEPQEEKKDAFVPLQSNRLSQWMHPWKKPAQFDVCPVELFARPKVIRGRHYPRARGQPAPPPPKPDESSSDEEDEEDTEEDTSSEEEETSSSEEDCEEGTANKGASTSSNDSGFGSGALSRNKGSLESRDSPTSNHANNPAFALDSGDIPEEYSQSSTYTGFQKSGRITPPATTIPRFRKYCVDDFNFLKVLGKGSFGKVLLAELKGTEYYYAIKCLKKDVVLEDDDVECTLIERKVLALGTKHPYLCHLLCTFQTESHLFFVMEYLNGGDLMFHIQASGRFPEHQARFYGAEIVSGLKFLHNKGIVYRDLKLDNILLDFDGHVRIADFGMCKLQIFLDRMAETFCGTPDYMAPEIIKGLHYNQCVDWWSFGVLLYEMLLGQSPFSGCDEDELFWSICNEKPLLPRYLSAEATNILTLFLEKDASKRLGNRFSPHGEIQDQPFFGPIDWHKLEMRQLESPFKPNLQHPLDTQYFDKHFTVERAKLTPIESGILQSMDQAQFQGFSYTNPNATDK